MPRAFTMSWEGPPAFRWTKMYKGVRYRVTCADLGAMVWTKEGSYKEAKAWWERKLAGLEGRPERLDKVRQILAGEDEMSRDARDRAATRDERNEGLQAVLAGGPSNAYARAFRDAILRGASEGPAVTSPPLREYLDGLTRLENPTPGALEDLLCEFISKATVEDLNGPVYQHVVALGFPAFKAAVAAGEDAVTRTPAIDPIPTSAVAVVPTARTVRDLASRWTAERIAEARCGARSADGAALLRFSLEHFVKFAGESTDVDSITADLWQRWYIHCKGHDGWSPDYASKVFSVSRTFIRWLWEREVLASLPRNLASRLHRFSLGDKEIPLFTDAEVKLLLDKALGQNRLHLLLMLNCGMTQRDVSDLLKDQCNLDAGTITRRRSKTKGVKGTPKVCYRLWPETLRLLKVYWSSHATLALTNEAGTVWVRKDMNAEGKLVRCDGISEAFRRLKNRVGMKGKGKSLKVFRKTSATRLKSHKDYRDLRYYFLGHSAKSVADRHYSAESQELLDEAVAWLGKQYGLV